MKKIKLFLLSMIVLTATSFAQEKSAGWAEMKAFHTLMAATFHPSEDGDLKPLKEKAADLLTAAKTWQASTIPADYKPEETSSTLKKLVVQCAAIDKAVKAGKSDEDLKKMIADAHDIFHKVAGECKKGADEHEGHKH
ncbi:MAG: hypothetical protein JST81_12490 [Bacteroidetes bacterium]|nr:hypothetical protein [Bacteroidota bacterium]